MARTKQTARLAAGPAAAAHVAQLRPIGTELRRSARLQTTKPEVQIATTRVTKSKAKPQPVRYECVTCTRTLAASSFPKYLSTDKCQHLINTCKACLKAWITSQMGSTTYDKIACPECPQIMQNSDMLIHATKADYARFEELERKAIAERIPGWRWCLNPKCKAGQVHQPLVEEDADSLPVPTTRKQKTRAATKKAKAKTENDDDICICEECGAQACVQCDRPRHNGETCEEFQKRMREDEEATIKLIAAECKKCPNTNCNKNIQKNGGCDHMICTQCNTQFCWHCRVTYNIINGGGAHGAGCVYALPGRIDPHAANFPQAAGFHQWAAGGPAQRIAQAAQAGHVAHLQAQAPHQAQAQVQQPAQPQGVDVNGLFPGQPAVPAAAWGNLQLNWAALKNAFGGGR